VDVVRNYLADIANRIMRLVPKEDLPQEDVSSLFLVYAVLLLAKGCEVTASDVHNAWVAWMAPRDPNHEALVPFEALPHEIALADEPFVNAILAAAREVLQG